MRGCAQCTAALSAGRRGRPPIGIERKLCIYFLQQWYALADEALEDTLYESQAMHSNVGIDLSVSFLVARGVEAF